MDRPITGYHQDDAGDWVAELSCGHSRHERHEPPFQQRPWVLTREGRAARIGVELACPACDLRELPAGLVHTRTAGPFDEGSIPPGLLRDHRTAAGVWAVLRVLSGCAGLRLETEPPIVAHLRAGDAEPIPPEVPHSVLLDGPVRFVVDFHARALSPASPAAAPAHGRGPAPRPRGRRRP